MLMLIGSGRLSPGHGGVKTFALGLTSALQRTPGEHEIVVVAPRRGSYLAEQVGCEEISSSEARRRASRQPACWLNYFNYGRLTASQPQVTVVHAPGLARSLATAHPGTGSGRLWYDAAKRQRFAAGLARSTRIVGVSEWFAALLREEHPGCAERIVAIHEGVDVDAIDPAGHDGRPGDDGLDLVTVGTLFAYKGHVPLMAALARLPHRRWRLTVIGRDADGGQAAVQRAATEHGVSELVDVVGPRPWSEAMARMATADVVICPSELETFGLPILEALALGRPVAANALPPFVETADGVADMAPVRDPEAFARAITAAAARRDDPTHATRARARAATFTWDGVAQRYLEVCHEVVASGGARR